jgi:signal transduction histidine kinase
MKLEKPFQNKNNSKPEEITVNGMTRTEPQSGQFGENGSSGKELNDPLMMRLQELEKHNEQLENLVKQQKTELTNVVDKHVRFVSIIAHDLRSPFSTVISSLDLLNKSVSECDKDEIALLANIAFSSSKRALGLLDSLLMWVFTQNDTHHLDPVKEKLHLYDLITEEIEDFNTTAQQKQITLSHSISPGLYILADLQMIKTVIRNLIDNAIKYTKKGGEVKIHASMSKQFIEIAVRDNGIGISEQSREGFLKMDKIKSTPGTNNEKGHGLGLMLCNGFVNIHGGNMYIDSHPNVGSEFRFTLPHYE